MNTHLGLQLLTVVTTVMIAMPSASALSQTKHAEISEAACRAAGFSTGFCRRVGDEVYNTDAEEFDDLAAHGQPSTGMTACAAATRSLDRLRTLGMEARTLLEQVEQQPVLAHKLARSLGRALHTIEDNCAHHGMPNPQHAWFSLNDACHFTSTSPDAAPAAFTCARAEAAAVMQAMIEVTNELGIDRSKLTSETVKRRFPPVLQACAFLADANDWDGRDRRWNNSVVIPKFRAQLVRTIKGGSDRIQGCASGETLARPNPINVDTSDGVGTFCEAVVEFCDGNGQNDGTTEPPWEHGDEEEEDHPTATGGCNATQGAGALLVLLQIAVIVVTRRRAMW